MWNELDRIVTPDHMAAIKETAPAKKTTMPAQKTVSANPQAGGV
jgi:hypothetical protein